MTEFTPEAIRKMIDGVERLKDTNEDIVGRIFVRDNDAHWYLIPKGEKYCFEKWVEWMESMADRPAELEGVDYDDDMVEPENTIIYKWS